MAKSNTAMMPSREPVAPPAKIALNLTINGTRRQLDVAPWTTLLDLLRDRLDLTGLDRLYGAPAKMGSDLKSRVGAVGIGHRAISAESREAATLVARVSVTVPLERERHRCMPESFGHDVGPHSCVE